MTMVSKHPLSKEVKDRVYEIFLQTLAELKTSIEVEDFLDQFLTPTEKIMLAKRLSIAFLLEKNYDARSISQILKVSTKTVSNVNLWIKHNKGGLYKAIQKLLEKKANEEFWNKIDYVIGRISIPMSRGNWSERRRNLEKEKFKSIKPF